MTIDLDYRLKKWDGSFRLLKELLLAGNYPNCMAVDGDHLLVGSENGTILILDPDLLIFKRIKVAEDLITGILVHENSIIVTTSDGLMIELDRKTQEKLRDIDLELPLSQVCFFDESYFVAGVSSWKVSRDLSAYEPI
jgi:hypothetical protein